MPRPNIASRSRTRDTPAARAVVAAPSDPDTDESAAPPTATTLLDALRTLDRELRVAPPQRHPDRRTVALPPAQARMLRELGAHAATSLAALAERMHTDPSSASVVVQRLVEQGFVARAPATDDRRRIELTITAAGRGRLRREPWTAERRLADAIARLGEPRAAAVARGLHALADALRPASPRPRSRATRPTDTNA